MAREEEARKGKVDTKALKELEAMNITPSDWVQKCLDGNSWHWSNLRRCDEGHAIELHSRSAIIMRLLNFTSHVEARKLMYQDYKDRTIIFPITDYDIYESTYDDVNNEAVFHIVDGGIQTLDELLFLLMSFWDGFYMKLLIIMDFDVTYTKESKSVPGRMKNKEWSYPQAIQWAGVYGQNFRMVMRKKYNAILESDYSEEFKLTPTQKDTATIKLDKLKMIRMTFRPWSEEKQYDDDYEDYE